MGPELGLTQPGMTVVCGDSHTATHGAFGALAFGIGTSEVEHVLATQCLLQQPSKTFEVTRGRAVEAGGVTAKDIILALIARIGVGGGTGCVLEYCGSAIRALSMEERMTVCNMSIEGGARAGLIAPDDTTFDYLHGRPFAPKGAAWDAALARWKKLPTDAGARYDQAISHRRGPSGADDHLRHQSRHGDSDHGARCPIRPGISDPQEREALAKALRYMDLEPGQAARRPPDRRGVHRKLHEFAHFGLAQPPPRFSRDARSARSVRVAGGAGLGSRSRRQAEAEGLDQVFKAAGAEWREPGCSMCIAMNGDQLQPGEYCVSTSNRNFEGRQGKGGRTFLASPLTAAASAIAGCVTDVRTLL